MQTDFHRELGLYLREGDTENARNVVLGELATSLVQDKENFVEVLNNAGVPASVEDSDVTLIEKFTQNAVANERLLLGAALLVNYQNRATNFDGEEEVSDAGVKNTYHVLKSSFMGDGEEYSNIIPALLGAGAKALAGAGGKAKEKAEQKKAEAERVMMQKALEKRRREAAARAKKIEAAKKKKNTIIIVGASVVVLAIVGFMIYRSKQSK